ncbi:sensor histidine kinase [Cohnella herbarum]|uniref:Histidine kinase n=1 Tax=Cohnella herbarum TaxID=2728023 RepID=A0A7Z2VL32_9BACL|nr:histidine kinase [Cohnella herbarum]QJD85021.1 histidine kinase [Cohnella herbarum]
MSHKRNWSLHSLRIKLSMSVLIMTVPLVGMLIYNNYYAKDVVREQVADSYKSSLSLYMSQIDSNLNDVDAYMITLSDKFDLLSLSIADTDDNYYMAKSDLFYLLSKDVSLYRSVTGFFVYESKRHDYMDILNFGNSLTRENRDVKLEVIQLIEQQRKSGKFTRNWKNIQINQHHYLLDIVRAGDAYLGVWISTDRLVSQLQLLKVGDDGEVLLINDEGKPITRTSVVQNEGIELGRNLNNYYLSGENRKYLVVGTHAVRASFSLVALIPDQHILANLPYLQTIIWIITITAIVFIPVGLILLRKSFLVPLNKVLSAMRKVRGGDWSVRVNMQRSSDEFNLLGESFNSMMTEIQTLRVNVFEEQLNKQREELRRLQLQVNPHFFLNALNILYNLAKVKKHDLIKEMSMSLIHYFRYLFRSNTSFVKLQNELDHTRNYLRIQCLRFPGQLTWDIATPNFLMEVPVPPLMIQSFVENSIKHAVTMDKPIHITVKIDMPDEAAVSQMIIQIRDTGNGFSNEVLQELQAGRNMENEEGEQIGIWNVRRRLCLLYGDHVTLRFRNDSDTGGAIVELIVPTESNLGVSS